MSLLRSDHWPAGRPQRTQLRLLRATYGVITGGAVLWCSAVVAAPLAAGFPGPFQALSEALYRFFHPLCHQFDSRSLHLAGYPLAVCARCTAIYAAFLMAALCYPVVRPLARPLVPSRWFLAAVLAPMLLDVAADAAGLHEITVGTRLLTGAVAGAGLPFIIIPAAQEALCQLLAARPSTHFQKGELDA